VIIRKTLVALAGLVLLVSALYYGASRSQPDLTVMGFINIRDGIGKQAIDLIETFQDDLNVNFVATSKSKMRFLDPRLAKLVKKSRKKQPFGKVVIFEDMLWTPSMDATAKLAEVGPDSIKIAYSMWESSRIPTEWVILLNREFDAVCVPSSFLVEVYHSSGVEIPIFVLPLGRDFASLAQRPLKQKAEDPFIFGNLSACSFRKNHFLLVRAFEQAFGNRKDVLLRINSRYGEKSAIEELTKYLGEQELENVIFTQFALDHQNYLEELQNIDCYVSPSKGEGFSIQPREAMALGIPVICTNNTGQIEICESELVSSIDTNVLEAALYPWGYYYGKNSTCTVDELANALVEMKENYDHYLQKGEEARDWALQYDFSNLKSLYKTIIQPEKIHLGDCNRIEEDCLITSSQALYDKYNRIFFGQGI